MENNKVVLAYSGGLDTSVILKWFKERGYEVIAYVADLGQKEDFDAVAEKAKKCGASKVFVEDLKSEFVTDFIFPSIKANAVYEGRYLLGTSVARPLIAKRQIEIAKQEGANIVSHGATGKGNDQVRFEMTCYTLFPEVKIMVPWRDEEFLKEFQGRSDLMKYAEKHGIPVDVTKDEPWSKDQNVMHISYESGMLEDPMNRPREDMTEMVVDPRKAPDKETIIEIEFEKGIPVKVKNLDDGTEKDSPLDILVYLNDLAGKNGIGIMDMVENRFVGIKSRGVYETPAGTVLHVAHRDLEGLTMDREVMHIRDGLVPKFAELVYYGFWYSPEMELLMSLIDKSQEYVSGKVRLALYKGSARPIGRESRHSLYDEAQSSMEVQGGYDQKDTTGFIKINALRLINAALRKGRAGK